MTRAPLFAFLFLAACQDGTPPADPDTLALEVEALQAQVAALEQRPVVGSIELEISRFDGELRDGQNSNVLCPSDTWMVGGGCDCDEGSPLIDEAICVNPQGCSAADADFAVDVGFTCQECNYAQWTCACADGPRRAWALCARPKVVAAD